AIVLATGRAARLAGLLAAAGAAQRREPALTQLVHEARLRFAAGIAAALVVAGNARTTRSRRRALRRHGDRHVARHLAQLDARLAHLHLPRDRAGDRFTDRVRNLAVDRVR